MTAPTQYSFEELTQHVIKAIAEVKEIPEDTVTLDSTFDELSIDSLDAMEMLFLMEEKLDVNMPDTAVRAMRNLRQVVEALDKLLKGEELDLPEASAMPEASGMSEASSMSEVPELPQVREKPQAEAG